MNKKDFKIGQSYKKIGGAMYLNEIGLCTEIDSDYKATLELPSGIELGCHLSPEWWELFEPSTKFVIGDRITRDGNYESEWFTYLGTTPDGDVITPIIPYETLGRKGSFKAYVWTLKDWKLYEEPKKETLEVTLQEIADKMGVNVKDLKIVESK